MTVPNLLTFIRIFLTPYLVWLLLNNRIDHALVVFFVAGITDGLDGFIARMFQQKSKLGAYLDPLADKLLLVSCFVLLGHLGLIPSWLVIIAVSRDAVILLGLMTLCFFQIHVDIRPTAVSKVTTLFQLFTILLVLATSIVSLPAWGLSIVFLVTAALSVVSGIHYIAVGVRLLEAGWFSRPN